MGLDLTSAPLGMWNRGPVLMGGRVLGDDMGRALSCKGGPRCGVGCRLVVVVEWVREAVCGRAWQVARGWGGAAAVGPTWIIANIAITPHSEQLAHNGYPSTCIPSIGYGDPRSSPLACTTWQPEITPTEVELEMPSDGRRTQMKE